MINRLKLLDELAALQQRLNEVFNEQYSEHDVAAGSWAPPVDIYETDDDVVVAAELPGVKREDVEVTVVGDKLILRGSRANERDSDDEQFHRMERQYGSFYRAFTLPQVIESETISAKLAQGILQVTLPKRPAAKAERIEVREEN
jgi:HSP20 family protein